MAALLRRGAGRIGGSVLKRTQAAVTSPAVAEEWLVPRRFSTDAEAKAKGEIQQQKEELYVALSKMENWRNRTLLQDLAAHIKPRPREDQWRRLRAARRVSNFITVTGIAGMVSCAVWYRDAVKRVFSNGEIGANQRKRSQKEVAQEFTITRCMEALKTLEGVTPEEKMRALEVFENAHNREFFVSLVDDKDGTAILWFRRQLTRLT